MKVKCLKSVKCVKGVRCVKMCKECEVLKVKVGKVRKGVRG